MVGPAWEPAGELERELLAARRAGDQATFLERLARADLLVPVPHGRDNWAFSEISGQRCVVSFTSTLTMQTLLSALPPYRTVRFFELASTWPDRSLCLAVDPGVPVEAYLTPQAVEDLARLALRPATSLEHTLADALAGADIEGYARALLPVGVVVPVAPGGSDSRDVTDPAFPWSRLDGGTGATVVFTSEERLREQVGERDVVALPFASLVRAWPGSEYDLVVDPGTPFGGLLPGPAVARLGAEVERIERITADAVARARGRSDLTEPEQYRLARDLIARALQPPAVPPPDAAVAVQVLVGPGQVQRYLIDGHSRVAGLVHRCPPDKVPLVALYERLSLLGEGSPFRADDEVGHVLRWYEAEVDAYRSPTMDGRELPEGSTLWRIDRTGDERLVAWYSGRTWNPAPS